MEFGVIFNSVELVFDGELTNRQHLNRLQN